MKTKEWIIKKLEENNWSSSIVSDLYEEYCRDFTTPCKRDSFARSVRFYKSKEQPLNNLKNPMKKDEVTTKEEINNDVYSAFVQSTFIKTPEQLIEHLNIDTNVWELSKFTKNFWGSSENPNFLVKGDFRKKKIDFNEKLVLDSIKEVVEKFKPINSKVSTKNYSSNNMLEIAIKDHHYGQLSNESESGEDYNLEIAKELYLNTVDYMLENSKVYKPEQIVFVVGSDYFNSDTTESTTYAGTYQAEADRWKKTFSSGVELVIEAIEKCKSFTNKVKVVMVQGNHDFTKSFYMGIALQQRYSQDKNVEIDCSETTRKYIQWGKSLICFTHGDKEVKGKLPLIISREQPKAFSECKYIEAHTGHLHKEREALIMCDEEVQIKIRILPSLVARDDWHASKGYMSVRESQSYIWNKEYGNLAVYKYHV